jgi:uncharacterized protein
MEEKTPFWKVPMVWLIIALPLAAVVGSLVSAWIASQGADPLVEEPHRKFGLTTEISDPKAAPKP